MYAGIISPLEEGSFFDKGTDMDKRCIVTYIKHSGVLVETKSSYLLFDYWEGELPDLDFGKDLYIFSSHIHRDHYTKSIFKLENRCINVEYILSSDIRRGSGEWRKAENVTFIAPCSRKKSGRLEIQTYRSTDAGVAFLVKIDGLTIYHAGDLHWWYWPEDLREDNEGRRKNNYLKEIQKLEGESPDISFVVLDPRQRDAGGYGMDQFLAHVHSRYVFPIHFWENYGYVRNYIDKNESKYPAVCLKMISRQGERFEIEF